MVRPCKTITYLALLCRLFSMRSIDFTFYFVRFEGCFDMNVAIDNHETHFQLSTLVSFSDKPVGWRIGFVLFSVIYQQVTVKVCKAFMYFFLVTLCFVVSFLQFLY